MGGERETLVPQKTRTSEGTHTIGQIRIHESKGEVHFHDDKNQLKVAVPVATWFGAYQEALANLYKHEWRYVDPTRKTMVVVNFRVRKANEKKGRPVPRAEATIRIEKVEVSDELDKLSKFTMP